MCKMNAFVNVVNREANVENSEKNLFENNGNDEDEGEEESKENSDVESQNNESDSTPKGKAETSRPGSGRQEIRVSKWLDVSPNVDEGSGKKKKYKDKLEEAYVEELEKMIKMKKVAVEEFFLFEESKTSKVKLEISVPVSDLK